MLGGPGQQFAETLDQPGQAGQRQGRGRRLGQAGQQAFAGMDQGLAATEADETAKSLQTVQTAQHLARRVAVDAVGGQARDSGQKAPQALRRLANEVRYQLVHDPVAGR